MASTYTNSGIEKPGSGDQSGTWGDTVNTNSDIMDRLISGVQNVALTGSSSSLTTGDGEVTEGHNKMLVYTGTLVGDYTVSISPNTAKRIYFVRNNTNRTMIFSQGTGVSVRVPSNRDAILYTGGTGNDSSVFEFSRINTVTDLSTITSDITALQARPTVKSPKYAFIDSDTTYLVSATSRNIYIVGSGAGGGAGGVTIPNTGGQRRDGATGGHTTVTNTSNISGTNTLRFRASGGTGGIGLTSTQTVWHQNSFDHSTSPPQLPVNSTNSPRHEGRRIFGSHAIAYIYEGNQPQYGFPGVSGFQYFDSTQYRGTSLTIFCGDGGLQGTRMDYDTSQNTISDSGEGGWVEIWEWD